MQWAGWPSTVRVLATAIVLINIALCHGLLAVQWRADEPVAVFRLDSGALSTFGARANVVGSVLDAAERQLGIDLRSTWALSVVRRSVEPLLMALGLIGWLSTSITIVGVAEQGLVERLGVPLGGPPLLPGLHVHWPWPVDRVTRLPVQRVQTVTVGHEGKDEAGGPEDVLWARQHAANEYTLLLGNGRDLITVDAAVQFRIADARGWHYHSQNPGDALRAIAHRAVMRTTVNRTLADALSENVVATTARMRQMVQQDADALGLGVEVLAFTVGGMHPPVSVSADYQAVVSAELGKITAVVNAEADRNRTVPFTLSAAEVGRNSAIADGARALAQAAGEAWSFLALQSEYRAAPDEYFFRRRLETLERGLPSRRVTILDYRFQRDGGELWVTP
jgi:regulator of protease activity HflC (stomatin/prohibitin superfamily)